MPLYRLPKISCIIVYKKMRSVCCPLNCLKWHFIIKSKLKD